jgi:hypothetical protein
LYGPSISGRAGCCMRLARLVQASAKGLVEMVMIASQVARARSRIRCRTPPYDVGGLESDLEDLYPRRHGAFQVMLASVTGRRRERARCRARTRTFHQLGLQEAYPVVRDPRGGGLGPRVESLRRSTWHLLVTGSLGSSEPGWPSAFCTESGRGLGQIRGRNNPRLCRAFAGARTPSPPPAVEMRGSALPDRFRRLRSREVVLVDTLTRARHSSD